MSESYRWKLAYERANKIIEAERQRNERQPQMYETYRRSRENVIAELLEGWMREDSND